MSNQTTGLNAIQDPNKDTTGRRLVKFHDKDFAIPLQTITGNHSATPEPVKPPAPTIADYEQYRITGNTPIPEPVPVITMGGATIADAQNIVVVSGESKSGKSALLGVMLAGAISQTGEISDPFEGLQIAPNEAGRAVIHIDTEQALHKQQRNVRSITRRAGFDEYNTPAHYLSYNIRELALSEYQAITDGICNAALHEFGGIHLLVIDGIADYIADVNSIEQSDDIVRFLAGLAIKYNTPILTVIHINPSGIGATKERGHLGSALQRKCQSLIRIIYNKDGDYSHLEPALLRDAGRGQVPLVMFKYDPGKGYHVAIGEKAEKEKGGLKVHQVPDETHSTMLQEAFANNPRQQYGELVRNIKLVFERSGSNLGGNKAKEFLTYYQGQGLIIKNPTRQAGERYDTYSLPSS